MNACLQLFDFAVDSTDLRVGVQNIGFALVSGLKMNDLLPIFVKSQSIRSYCYYCYVRKQTTSCLNFLNDNPIQWTPIIPPPFNSCFRMFLWHWDYPITSVLEAHVCGGDPHVNHNAKISQHGLQNCWIKWWHKFHHVMEFSWQSKMTTWHNKGSCIVDTIEGKQGMKEWVSHCWHNLREKWLALTMQKATTMQKGQE